MRSSSDASSPPDSRRLLAPRWHTAGLFGILLAALAVGAWLQRRGGAASGPGLAPAHRGVLGIYAMALGLDWGLFYYVWASTSQSGTPLSDLVGGRWAGWRDVLRDVAIAAPFWVVWHAAALLTHRLLGPNAAKSVDVLLPRGGVEIGVWILVCLTAGFCEEVVFRGYLQRQLRAMTGSAALGVALQAIAFGIAHGYQGAQNVVVITVLGALYGLLALWRRSTRPGMIAHAWSDVYGGLQMQFLSRILPF